MAINGSAISLPSITPQQPTKNPLSSVSVSGNMGAQANPLSQLTVTPSMLSTPLKVTTAPISAITQKPVASYGSASSGGSIVDYLNGQGKASDYNTRAALAASNGITGYTGSAAQNTQLLGLLRNSGVGTPTPTPTPIKTATGGTVLADSSGNVTSPSTFKIDTGGAVPSSALSSGFTGGDVTNQLKTYSDYVNGLSQAQQYSPEYLNALESYNKSKLQEAQINSNFYTGQNLPGDTLPYAQGETARALQQNQLSQLGAAQQEQVQELIRQGNIGAAQALVDAYKPQSVSPGSSLVSPANGQVAYGGTGAYSDYQAQQTYFNLAQNFPDAQIPSYDPNLSAQQNLQVAQKAATQAPSFQSRNLIEVTDAAGGVHFVQKNQLQTNADGSYTYIAPGTAATQGAAKGAIADLTKQKADTQRAIDAAEANYPLLIKAAQDAGVGANTPLFINGIKQKAATQLGSAGYAALQTFATSLQTEYSQIIARGGSVTNETRNNAQSIINGSYNLNQLNAVHAALSAESQNVLKGYDSAIASQQKSLSPDTSGASGGSVWNF